MTFQLYFYELYVFFSENLNISESTLQYCLPNVHAL